nr:uncharacterized protein LOC111418971 isoform X1 [Onthophagus taurus]
MICVMEIQNIKDLIGPLLKGNKKYLSHEQEKLLQVGENYGSVILKLVVYCEDENGKKEEHHCIAKLVPPSSYIQKIFKTKITFKKEIRIYDTIIPLLRSFGEEHGVKNLLPFFGKYIGSRISLNPKSVDVDNDAALILRNLSYDGYVVCDRFIGFNKETMELLLKDLATMHATTIGYKLQKPEEFNQKILPHFFGTMDWDYNDITIEKYQDQYGAVLEKDPDCSHLRQKVLHSMNKAGCYYGSKPREPFATMIHQDLWVNNMMLKFIDGKPISSKFIDFQIMAYGNPACDVLFLIYTSAQIDLLHLVDDFVKIYFDHFITILKNLHCDITNFTFEAFQNEMYIAATDFTFVHILYMLAITNTLTGKAKDITEMTGHEDCVVPNENLHELFYRRLLVVVKEFGRKGWIP